jgi:hypothetical protein
MVLQVVVLCANGESRQTRITSGEATAATVSKLLRKTRPAVEIGKYVHDELTLTVWGWCDGKAGTENKHELPPPLDEVLLFGDAVVSASATEDGAAHGMSVATWEAFYKEAFKGFHATESDAGSEDAGSADEGDDDVEEDVGDEDVDPDEEIAEDEEEEVEDEEAEEEEEEEDVDEEEAEDCYDDEDGGGGGGKRRAPRRRATTAPEYRRLEMGLRARVKVPMPIGKRAPRWQTAPELVEEAYE